ncbi:sensor histidine kinase [Paraflavitalea sp. CAU 1676]|uniref:sensor histidine kinase n=1 Tax=Paraflavitalea sp. CAU 1676 TaxID=3032598 RepID=UPI0023DA1D52|nr:sensor histidine kinase [Paraflavitalea sp. CAU 1676]MDF2187921.1 sensor histidine kinase [Paraflavitalea sp. CAU 1676]
MFRVILLSMFLFQILSLMGQAPIPAPSTIPGYTFHPRSEDKPSWQRLNLLLGATYLVVAKEGQADIDSCIQVASRTMGISRYSLLAEGIDDPDLAAQSNWLDRQDPGTGKRLLANTTGKKHLLQLLLLGAYYAFQPYNYYRHKDSVEYFLTRAINESKSLREDKLTRVALGLLVKVYSLGNEQLADSTCQELIKQCRIAGDRDTEARALAYRSKFTPPRANTIQKKMNDAEQAAALYDSLGNFEGEINALTDLGYLSVIAGNLPAAYDILSRALELAEKIGYPYTHYNSQALTTITFFQGKFGEPLRYTYQTIRTAEATRDSLAWCYFYTRMAAMMELEGREEECFYWSQRSLHRFVADRNPSGYRILNDVVEYMGKRGRSQEALDLARDIADKIGYPTTFSDRFAYHLLLSSCYLNLKLLDEAEMEIRKMDELEKGIAMYIGPMRRFEIDVQWGQLFLAKGEYLKARQYFEKQFNSPRPISTALVSSISLYRSLIYIDSALGDHAAAVGHYKKYAQLLDSSFRISKTRQAEELQVVYQMNEKENQITSLMQQSKLEKANSEKAAIMKDLTIAGIIGTLIIAGLLYRQNRLRKKSNEVITEKNSQLQQLLSDKEWLLKEIHHRVKNNLQIVISLLDSQSEYIDNDAALAAIEENMQRVHAMALIHQKLYQSEDVSTIAMPEYINELVHYAQDSFDTGNQIHFERSVEPIDLDVSQAIPLGLIINECIVNAIKYAFPMGRKGVVRIHLHRSEDHSLSLEIADNGIGLPEGFDPKSHASLGLDLMQGLTRQLNGSFTMESNQGLRIAIKFAALRNQLLHGSLAIA